MNVIHAYLKNVAPQKRQQLERIYKHIKELLPEGEDTICYAMPTIKYKGKAIIGFDAHKHHIGIYPYSSEVIELLKGQLKEYTHSKGAIQIPLDKTISNELLESIVQCSLKQKGLS